MLVTFEDSLRELIPNLRDKDSKKVLFRRMMSRERIEALESTSTYYDSESEVRYWVNKVEVQPENTVVQVVPFNSIWNQIQVNTYKDMTDLTRFAELKNITAYSILYISTSTDNIVKNNRYGQVTNVDETIHYATDLNASLNSLLVVNERIYKVRGYAVNIRRDYRKAMFVLKADRVTERGQIIVNIEEHEGSYKNAI